MPETSCHDLRWTTSWLLKAVIPFVWGHSLWSSQTGWVRSVWEARWSLRELRRAEQAACTLCRAGSRPALHPEMFHRRPHFPFLVSLRCRKACRKCRWSLLPQRTGLQSSCLSSEEHCIWSFRWEFRSWFFYTKMITLWPRFNRKLDKQFIELIVES